MPHKLSIGTRLEVKWDLVEKDEIVPRWWGCQIQRATGRKNGDGLDIFEVLYDSYAEFPKAKAEVSCQNEMCGPMALAVMVLRADSHVLLGGVAGDLFFNSPYIFRSCSQKESRWWTFKRMTRFYGE